MPHDHPPRTCSPEYVVYLAAHLVLWFQRPATIPQRSVGFIQLPLRLSSIMREARIWMRRRRGCRWVRMNLAQEVRPEFVDAGGERRQIMVSRRESSVHEG